MHRGHFALQNTIRFSQKCFHSVYPDITTTKCHMSANAPKRSKCPANAPQMPQKWPANAPRMPQATASTDDTLRFRESFTRALQMPRLVTQCPPYTSLLMTGHPSHHAMSLPVVRAAPPLPEATRQGLRPWGQATARSAKQRLHKVEWSALDIARPSDCTAVARSLGSEPRRRRATSQNQDLFRTTLIQTGAKST